MRKIFLISIILSIAFTSTVFAANSTCPAGSTLGLSKNEKEMCFTGDIRTCPTGLFLSGDEASGFSCGKESRPIQCPRKDSSTSSYTSCKYRECRYTEAEATGCITGFASAGKAPPLGNLEGVAGLKKRTTSYIFCAKQMTDEELCGAGLTCGSKHNERDYFCSKRLTLKCPTGTTPMIEKNTDNLRCGSVPMVAANNNATQTQQKPISERTKK